MAKTHFKGNPTNTVADIPAVGSKIPDSTLVGMDMSEVKLSDYAGQWLLVNSFPSLDTGVCAASVREFNKRAANLENTVVLNVSKDLPLRRRVSVVLKASNVLTRLRHSAQTLVPTLVLNWQIHRWQACLAAAWSW